MRSLEDKAAELVEHFEKLVFRFLMTEQHTPHLCGGHFSKQELKVIHTLGKYGPCNMGEIADRLMLALSSATSVVDKLVEKSLISRERPEGDRRIVKVALTPEGQDLYRIAREARMNMGRGMLSTLNKQEQDELIALFRKMTEHIEQHPARTPEPAETNV
jgi:DNA-binding MarR family transcriptional regulator